jgi:hypothetical protein
MPKNKVSDPITDQEMAFAHLVLSGTMTDRAAAEAVGLNPESAAYTKSKSRVRTYMAEHRAALREKLLLQESEGLRKLNVGRDKVLELLWNLATLPPDVTRGNINGQLKAVAMFASMGGLFPVAPAAEPEQASAPPPVKPQIYVSEWRREQPDSQSEAVDSQAEAVIDEPGCEEPSVPVSPSVPESVPDSTPELPPLPQPPPASPARRLGMRMGMAARFGARGTPNWVPEAYR